jgi:hypothetical protein
LVELDALLGSALARRVRVYLLDAAETDRRSPVELGESRDERTTRIAAQTAASVVHELIGPMFKALMETLDDHARELAELQRQVAKP